ncbi:MAG: MotA/TolQ/ExbB proton channel family protein [Gammaproteobacteria bacterium]|nr:MotA/TolQ/ExbB proton channel family protein [Gammaproteobacteria bacterium]
MRAEMISRRMAAAGLALALIASAAVAADDKKDAPSAAQTLEQLLDQTRNARAREAEANKAREARFISERNRQAEMLSQAKAEKSAQERRAADLGKKFDGNEKKLTELQAVLDAKGGNLGELFGSVRQVAGDVSSVLFNSMITARYTDRDEFVSKLSQTKSLPSIEELEKLWFEMQREMTETGRTARFTAKVVLPDGTAEEREVVTVGPFTAVSDGRFLNYLTTEKALAEQPRQPDDFLSLADDMGDADEGVVGAVVDPTRGILLSLYQQRPNMVERISQGHAVGYLILLMGLVATIMSVYQFRFLTGIKKAVGEQLKSLDRPSTDNPLGRVLATFKGDPKMIEEDAEVVELRISEAVMREVPVLERFQGFLRLVVAAGPLFGLIGTVIGMIITFQSITESGSGDPRLMATGISQAMIATVLGLGISIPFLFVNAALQSLSRGIVQILDEQSTGLLAEHIERKRGRA